MQRHLNEPRTANGVLNHSKSTLRWTRKSARPRTKCGNWQERCELRRRTLSVSSINRWIFEIRRENDIIVGTGEARMIEDVEHLRVVSQCEPFGKPKLLENTKIKSVLKRTTENVALIYCRKSGFKIVACARHWVTPRPAVRSGRERYWRAESIRIENRVVRIYSGRALQQRLVRGRSQAPHRNQRIRNEILSLVKNAGNGAAEIIHAIWVPALKCRNATNPPSVDRVFFPSRRI